jgi:uncharacterized OsmC-like protein
MAENPLERIVVVEASLDGMRQEVQIGPFKLVGDGPPEYGGTDTGPNPYDYLLTSLGTCTGMTVSDYARELKIPLERIRVKLTHASIYAKDCRECHTKEGTVFQITREIEVFGSLTDEQRQKLKRAAEKCPVSQILTHEIKIDTSVVVGGQATASAGQGASASP